MQKKTLEFELLYESGYGKIWLNKQYRLVEIDTNDPEGFAENLSYAIEVLHKEAEDGHDPQIIEEFLQAQTAGLAIQSCDIICRHLLQWNPMIEAIKQMAEQAGANTPLEKATFIAKTFKELRENC
jgi:hypothetical protein